MCTKFGNEAHEPWYSQGEPRKVFGFALVPTKPDVRIGPAELWEVGEHAGVGDGFAGGIGLLERSFDPAIEHRLVPRRQLLCEHGACALLPVRSVGARRGSRVVMSRPLNDRRVMTERINGGFRLTDRFPTHCSGMAPLQREVLQD